MAEEEQPEGASAHRPFGMLGQLLSPGLGEVRYVQTKASV